ncbi:MAG: hypothetical protein VZQ62_00345 [Methanosphaera sp.]|nr:hypothetical protein [Methanosphaera sp.]
MNEETMRKHYERTPKEILINILISSREEVEKLQKRNKERKQEIERLNNIIKDIKSQLDYLETYSSKEDVFEDMKRRLDRIDKIIGSDINEPNE